MSDNKTPSESRALSDMRERISKGRHLAIYLGAGVDKAIAHPSELPGWAKLVYSLMYPEDSAQHVLDYKKYWLTKIEKDLERHFFEDTTSYPSCIAQIKQQIPEYIEKLPANFIIDSKQEFLQFIEKWPTEFASVATATMSEDEIRNKLHDTLDPPKNVDIGNKFTRHLIKLCKHTNLLVTSNYSEWIRTMLQKGLKNGLKDRQIIVVSREDLAGLPFPRQHKMPGKSDVLYLIHLHGRTNNGNKPILDAWGYSVARDDDQYYYNFLKRLFTERDVLTIGTSWDDVPLRNAAAYAIRTHRYSRRCHLAIMFKPDDKDGNKRSKPEEKLSQAMRSCYGVEFLFANEDSQNTILKNLSGVNIKPPSISTSGILDLDKIAKFLEDTGDFEAFQQYTWLTGSGNGNIQINIDRLYNQLIKQLDQEPNSWPIVAKIERHLRHHSYLHLGANYSKRAKLYQSIITAIHQKKINHVNHRILFDLWIGQFEIKEAATNLDFLREPFQSNKDLYNRTEIASTVWSKHWLKGDWSDKKDNKHKQILDQALDYGWESIAAKLANDKAKALARNAFRKKGIAKYNIQVEIEQAASIAGKLSRQAGSFWRELMADVLAAAWATDPQEGRIRILSRMHALRSGESLIEQPLYYGLATALISCHVKIEKEKNIKPEDAINILKDAGFKFSDTKNSNDLQAKPHTKLWKYWFRLCHIKQAEAIRGIAETTIAT